MVIVKKYLKDVCISILSPLFGRALAALFYGFITKDKEEVVLEDKINSEDNLF